MIAANNDARNVTAALSGDRDAFMALVHRYERRVYAIAYSKLMNHPDAEDATQATFLAAYERLGQVRAPDRFGGWIARVALTQVEQHTRRYARETVMDVAARFAEAPDPVIDQERFEWDEDVNGILRDALHALPEPLRLVLALRYMSDETYDGIAETLMISRNAAERRVQRAINKLQAYFRRRGITEEALLPALVSGLAYPSGAGSYNNVTEGIHGRAAGQARLTTPGLGGIAAAALGVAVLVGSLGVFTGVVPMSWGSLKARASAEAARPANEGVEVTLVAGPRPRVNLLIPPGDEWSGWEALEPTRDARTPTLGSGPGRARVATVANDYGVTKPLPVTHGEVTLTTRLRVGVDRTNAGVGFTFAGSRSGRSVFRKNETNTWFRYLPGAPDEIQALDAVQGRWRDVVIVYRTADATYDLMLDGAIVARNAPFMSSLVGRPITGLYIASGRDGRPEPMLLSGLRVTAREGSSAPRAGRAPTSSTPRGDQMSVVGGMLAGARLHRARSVARVAPGEGISGSVELAIHNGHGSTASFVVVEVATWEDHETGFRELHISAPRGDSRHVVRIDRRAPARPGTYHIVFVAAAEKGAGFVASGTNWPVGDPVWHNGADIAGWSRDLIEEAKREGRVVAPWLCGARLPGATAMERFSVAAAAVEVAVGAR